jgi:hypothetical protein
MHFISISIVAALSVSRVAAQGSFHEWHPAGPGDGMLTYLPSNIYHRFPFIIGSRALSYYHRTPKLPSLQDSSLPEHIQTPSPCNTTYQTKPHISTPPRRSESAPTFIIPK